MNQWKRRRLGWLVAAAAVAFGCEEKPAAPKAEQPAPAPAPASAVNPAPSPEPTPAPTAKASAEPEQEPEAVAAQHVLIAYRGAKSASKDVTRSKAAAKKLAEEVAKKAREGADFTALAQEHSDCPSKANRGNLGKFKRDAMDPKFADAAFALRVGKTSDVVETPFGYHIIKRNQ
jgi:hypothetical protein